MSPSPILSFEETTSVDSIDALVGLYAQKGFSFPEQRNFVHAVRRDWRLEQRRLFKEAKAKAKEASAQLPSLEVLVDGTAVSIHGVTHKPSLGKQFIGTVTYAVNTSNHANWLFEQNVKKEFRSITVGIELPDHLLYHWKELFTEDFLRSLRLGAMVPVIIPLSLVRLPTYYASKLYSVISQHGKSQDSTVWFLNVPLRAWAFPLPAYVDIQMREMGNKEYNQAQRRSAYSAEFLRLWRVNEERGIVAGTGHAPEAEYFLKHGVKDAAITELAHCHVELLEQDPERFSQLHRQANFKYLPASFAGQMAASLLIGITYSEIGNLIIIPAIDKLLLR